MRYDARYAYGVGCGSSRGCSNHGATQSGGSVDLAEVSPFASISETAAKHAGPDQPGVASTSANGDAHIAQQGSLPQTTSSMGRQVSWHDFHGKNLVEVREFEPRCACADGGLGVVTPCRALTVKSQKTGNGGSGGLAVASCELSRIVRN